MHRDVNVRGGRLGVSGDRSPVGAAFVYRSAIWKIKGLYLSAGSSEAREVWWILGEQPQDELEPGGGGHR